MLGTGFEGEPREPIARRDRRDQQPDAPVVACDVPSGVDAVTGEVEGDAVRAGATGTFHGPKVGLHVNPARSTPGDVRGGRDRHPPRRARRRAGRA